MIFIFSDCTFNHCNVATIKSSCLLISKDQNHIYISFEYLGSKFYSDFDFPKRKQLEQHVIGLAPNVTLTYTSHAVTKSVCHKAKSAVEFTIFVQFWKVNVVPQVNKPYVNGVTLREQNLS